MFLENFARGIKVVSYSFTFSFYSDL